MKKDIDISDILMLRSAGVQESLINSWARLAFTDRIVTYTEYQK